MKKEEVVSGLVKEIDSVFANFKFIKIIPIKEGIIEEEVPFYGNIEEEYIGKFVTIITRRTGFLGKTFEQIIEGLYHTNRITMPYSQYEDRKKAHSLMGIEKKKNNLTEKNKN